MPRMIIVRRGSHLERPVYWSVKTSQSEGAQTPPSHATLSQKSVVGKSGLASSNAYASDHSATASISKQNEIAPGAGRRCQAEYASAAAIIAEMIIGST